MYIHDTVHLYSFFRFPPLIGMYMWPTLADVNTRARRLVSAWVKHQKKEEQKQVHLLKVKLYTQNHTFTQQKNG